MAVCTLSESSFGDSRGVVFDIIRPKGLPMPRKSTKTQSLRARFEQDPDSLSGKDWAQLVAFDPAFAVRCDWTKLDGYDWARLLGRHPEYADECDWALLDFDNWNGLLSRHREFSEHLAFDQWLSLINEFPAHVGIYDLARVDKRQWLELYDARSGIEVCFGAARQGVAAAELTEGEWLALYGLRRHLKFLEANGFTRAKRTSARHRALDVGEWYEKQRKHSRGAK